jgi:DNA repair exonuclease SbcCD ATPase subunit
MALLHHALLLALIAGAVAVSPVAQVINLVQKLEAEVEKEGNEEGATYEKFACFCKDTSTKKSDSVIKLNDKIEVISADIADKTQSKKDDISELQKRKSDQEVLSKELDDHNARCTKEEAEYTAEINDLNKAVSSLTAAIKAMETTGGPSAAVLLQIQSVLSLSTSLRKVSVASHKSLAALRKVDPNDAEYEYHSNDILNLCKSLLNDPENGFKAARDNVNSEWQKTDLACKASKQSLGKEMTSNKRNMDRLDGQIETLAKKIAEAREDLVEADGALKDDQLYLKDLTARCEARAKDYDQRSQMRGDELGALKQALDILTNDVADRDADVNQRAALLQKKVSSPVKSISFLQDTLQKTRAGNFLARSAEDLSLEAKTNRALAVLRNEGRRIGSLAISALASRSAADPFKKVKGLIQRLIERLLEESKNEATKKGFCDEALGSARHERNHRFEQANDLSREIAGLEAKRDELTEEIEVLTKDIKDETADLKTATDDRKEEKADNTATLSTAKEGLEAVSDALGVLRSFYSQAAKASAFVQASPVDEDAPAVASGSYKGKQGGMKSIFALLEVIESDFDRTIRTTEKEEAASHRAFVELSQASKSSIAGKTTKKELDEQDLKTTETLLKQKSADLEDTQDLLDKSLQELEKLKPTCIDTGMSYEDRVKKREEEMKALETALCILDTEKVEASCA